MIKRLMKIYMVVLEIVAYAIVVISASFLCVLGAVYQGWTFALLGLITGFMAGIIIDLVFIPPIAVLFQINDNLSKIRDYLKPPKIKSEKSESTQATAQDSTDAEEEHKEKLRKQRESLSKLYNNSERNEKS